MILKRVRVLLAALAEPTAPPYYKTWEILLAGLVPSLTMAALFLMLALPGFFLPNYQDVGPPLGTTALALHGRLLACFALPPFIIYAVWMRRLFIKRHQELEIFWPCLLLTGLVLFLLVPVTYEIFDVGLDRSEPLLFQAVVADKYVENSAIGTEFATSLTTYVLKLPSWRRDREWHALAVKKKEYERAAPGRTAVVLRIRPGRFGQPWLESYELREPR